MGVRPGLLPAAQALEARSRLGVDAVAQPAGQLLAMHDSLQIGKEGRRTALSHLLSARASHRSVGAHEQNCLVPASFGRQPLEQRIGVRGKPDDHGAHGRVLPDTVEDDDPSSAAQSDEARKQIDQLVPISKAARVEEIRAVEQVKRRLGQLSILGRG